MITTSYASLNYVHTHLNSDYRRGIRFEEPPCFCLKDKLVDTKTCLLSQISTFKWFSNVVASFQMTTRNSFHLLNVRCDLTASPPQESRHQEQGCERLCEQAYHPLPWCCPTVWVRTQVRRTRKKLIPCPPRPVEGVGAVVVLGWHFFFHQVNLRWTQKMLLGQRLWPQEAMS